MAGSNSGFDANAFRTGIRFAMNMGLPTASDDQPVFYFNATLVYNAPVDDEDVPFDPQATVTRVAPRPVRGIACAIEYVDEQGQEVVFGNVTAARIKVLLLDEEYAKVKGFDYVVLGGEKYVYKTTEAPLGLFDVGVWTVHCTAEDKL